MLFTQCTIIFTMNFVPSLPLFLCFRYNIPKGALVIANMWNVNMDPNEWPNPTEFRPERFLDSDGKIVRREKLIPFGIGK